MSNNNFWNENNSSVSEYDLLEDAQEVEEIAEQYASEPVVVEASEEDLEQVMEDSAYNLNVEESNIVYNAKLRLEQARLYDMLINHNLFEGVEASEQAVAIVSNELKHYIVRRLEILLGIRQPRPRQVERESPASTLNPVELDFLKQLAYKGTKGQSALVSQQSQQQARPAAPKPAGLKPLVQKQAQPQPKPIVKDKDPRKEVVKQPPQQEVQAVPQKPKKNNVKPRQKVTKPSGNGRNLTQAEIMELAKRDLQEMEQRKPWAKMSQKEKEAEVKRVNEKHAKPRPKSVAPMPTFEQQQQMYMTQQQLRTGSQNQVDQFNSILANVLASRKNNEE